MRTVGTTVRGIRGPVIRPGDDLASIVVDSLIEASNNEGFVFGNKDVVAITEAVVAKAQNNFATVDDIASDIHAKYTSEEVGIVFPILSRNRFATCLKGIARAKKKIFMQLSFPCDEVGNELFNPSDLKTYDLHIDQVFYEEEYRKNFGKYVHMYTGVNYVDYYRKVIEEEGGTVEFIFSNNPLEILKRTKYILVCDIHTRENTKRILRENQAELVYGLDEILNKSINGSGYNEQYGLLGSNKSTEEKVKLFPRECNELLYDIQQKIKERTNKEVEVMVYGDGAFKDPVGKIWELADPVVSPFYTKGLLGSPVELKLKYLSDTDFKDLSGDALVSNLKETIAKKDQTVKADMKQEGTTPRRYIDLLGSLCDLTTGSGDKGTPFVLVQGYFDNFSNE